MASFIKVEGIFHSALFTIHVVDEIHFFTKKQRYSVDKERYTDIYILNLLFDIYMVFWGIKNGRPQDSRWSLIKIMYCVRWYLYAETYTYIKDLEVVFIDWHSNKIQLCYTCYTAQNHVCSVVVHHYPLQKYGRRNLQIMKLCSASG